MTEAAEEIRAAADPEANIIFGTSFNERLGDEVMITVIATGFDGTRRQPRQAAASQSIDASAAGRAPRERDFLEELERQRVESSDGGFLIQPDDQAAAMAAPAPARSVGEPVPVKRSAAYDADDLEIPSFLRRK